MWGEVVSRAVKGRKPHRKLAEFTPCCNERRWSALFNSLRFWDFFCNWLLTKVFIIFFFNLFSIACQGTQPYHAMCSNSNQPPLCWTVDWTWLPLLQHLPQLLITLGRKSNLFKISARSPRVRWIHLTCPVPVLRNGLCLPHKHICLHTSEHFHVLFPLLRLPSLTWAIPTHPFTSLDGVLPMWGWSGGRARSVWVQILTLLTTGTPGQSLWFYEL